LDLFGPATHDPYAVYDQLREAPPRFDERLGAWLVARYADVAAALRDPRLMCPVPVPPASPPAPLDEVADELHALFRFRCLVMNHRQGEGHERLRRLLQPLFAPAALAALRPGVQVLVEQLLDRVQAAGRMDVMADFTTPLAIGASALIVGVPPADAERVAALCDDVYYPWPEALNTDNPDGVVRDATTSLRELAAYLDDLAAARRDAPAQDVISALAQAVACGELSQAELVANAGFLFVAGRHTTAHTIATAVQALLAFPDQLQRVREDPARIGPLVEECLRYDGPAVSVARVAVRELEIGGARIRPGEALFALLGGANRDPAHFSDPHRLDIERRQNAHLSFGAGVHYCVGAPLARLEAATALNAIARLPGLRAASAPAIWQVHPTFRLLESLPVEWDTTPENSPARGR
jgi:pimeloyl-[acyl-carrier protein] synthase